MGMRFHAPERPSPVCPACGRPPVLVLDDGHQSFCGDDGCHVVAWDQYLTLAELVADAGEIRVEP